MKTCFIVFAIFTLFACQDKPQKNDVPQPERNMGLIVEYTPVYFSENVKPNVVGWEEFTSLQNKVYELKNTTTSKLENQINDLDVLVANIYNDNTPIKLQVFSFENKAHLLENAVFRLKNSISDLSFEEKTKAIQEIFRAFNALKNQINAIYA